MKSISMRMLVASVFAIAVWLLLAAAGGTSTSNLQPDKLVIVSTTDVKGKTGPCG
jgi:hypothetical protein